MTDPAEQPAERPNPGLLRSAIRDGIVPPAESDMQERYEEALADLLTDGVTTLLVADGNASFTIDYRRPR